MRENWREKLSRWRRRAHTWLDHHYPKPIPAYHVGSQHVYIHMAEPSASQSRNLWLRLILTRWLGV